MQSITGHIISMKNNNALNGSAPTDKKEAKSLPVVTIDTTNSKPQATTEAAKAEPDAKLQAPTVEDVREKNLKLNDLFEKEEKLKDTQASLKSFKVASNEFTNTLDIADGRGSTFRTYNPQVIGAVIELIKNDIEVKLSTTQTEILSLA